MLSLLQSCFVDNDSTIADSRLNNKPDFRQMHDCMHIACIEYDILQAGEEADWHVGTAVSTSAVCKKSGTVCGQQSLCTISLYLIQQAGVGEV